MNMSWCWHQFCGESNFLMSSTKSHRALFSDTRVLGSSQQTQAFELLSMRIISCESCYNTSRVKYYSITIPKNGFISFFDLQFSNDSYIYKLFLMCQTFPPRGTAGFTKDPPTSMARTIGAFIICHCICSRIGDIGPWEGFTAQEVVETGEKKKQGNQGNSTSKSVPIAYEPTSLPCLFLKWPWLLEQWEPGTKETIPWKNSLVDSDLNHLHCRNMCSTVLSIANWKFMLKIQQSQWQGCYGKISQTLLIYQAPAFSAKTSFQVPIPLSA